MKAYKRRQETQRRPTLIDSKRRQRKETKEKETEEKETKTQWSNIRRVPTQKADGRKGDSKRRHQQKRPKGDSKRRQQKDRVKRDSKMREKKETETHLLPRWWAVGWDASSPTAPAETITRNRKKTFTTKSPNACMHACMHVCMHVRISLEGIEWRLGDR